METQGSKQTKQNGPTGLMPLLFDRKTTAKLLSVSIRSVDYLIELGKLRPRKIGTRVLIPSGQVVRMAEVGCPYGMRSKEKARP